MHEHQHSSAERTDARMLRLVLMCILGFMAVEIIVGLRAHSIALIADAGHMIADAGAIGITLGAMNLGKRPASITHTFGLKRAEVLAAGMNALLLILVGVGIVIDAVLQLMHQQVVDGLPVVLVATVGILFNLGVTRLMLKTQHHKIHIRGALLHILGDLVACIATAVAGIIILTTRLYIADSIASMVIALFLFNSARMLLAAAGHVLMEGTPASVDLAHVREHLLDIPHVQEVHDLHAWIISTDLPAISAHVVVNEECFQDGHAGEILLELQECVEGHFDIEHSTFQIEPYRQEEHAQWHA